MGGGYALAAVMGKADIMSVYSQSEVSSDDYVNQIGTLNGNPIACAAGLATLDQLKQPGAYEKYPQSVPSRIRAQHASPD